MNKDKKELKDRFFTDFYLFLTKYTDCNLEGINLDSFIKLASTWEVDGRSDLYHFGDRFSEYFIEKKIGGKLEEQSDKCFIGYCSKSNMYIDLIHHLEVFFAYWRTDEGYSKNDPLGNDFYAIPWASMVDTAKFFFFDSTNLNEYYPWLDSARVKYMLDNIPECYKRRKI